VLIVDDNAVNRRILHDLLTRWHMRPTVVENGAAALRALEEASRAERPFSLLLLDVNMPGMDGFELTARIRSDPRLATATILMLSSSGMNGDRRRCAELGITRHLTKPIDQRQLLAAIERAIDRAVPALPPPAALRPGTRIDERSGRPLRVLVAEDNVVNQRLAAGMLRKHGHHVTIVNHGREALAAIEREPFDVVLMDVQMPEMGGFEVTAAIRAREAGSSAHLPIIAMTADAMKGDRERCVEAGMDEYISKPLDARTLCELVDRLANPPAA
jgi:CheY-like chemotaxis protein